MTAEPAGAPPAETGFDYVGAGAGAGGGPPAADLVTAGMRARLLAAPGPTVQDAQLLEVILSPVEGTLAGFHAPQPGTEPDRCYRAGQRGEGLGTTNGAVGGITRKSLPEPTASDLFVFGGPFDFRSYYPGCSPDLTHHEDRITWAILKSFSHNTEDRLRLRSIDSRDIPLVHFPYFTAGTGTGKDGPGLEAMTHAVEFVRGVDHLRIVDASVLPRIPGFFVAAPST
ncbi:hypothetical protein [Streptomyces viridosporus]|uniref:hypothetical protein n=1 Tax=Streptomyces viridosporus TaxID=67581 RepID=UPI0009BD713E|nr:hypothetical protein [Streptomyces viridosporus]